VTCLASTVLPNNPLISLNIFYCDADLPKNYITTVWLSQVIASKSISSLYFNYCRMISLIFDPSVYITRRSLFTIYCRCISNTGIDSFCTEVSIIPLIPLRLKSRKSSNTVRSSLLLVNSIEGPKYIRMIIRSC
jgi:hypothetical protein